MTRPPVGSTGTLAELQVEPGDVVALTSLPNEKMTVSECPPRAGTFADRWQLECEVMGEGLYCDGIFRLISRANPDQPAQRGQRGGWECDLTALETPHGPLLDLVQEALKIAEWRPTHIVTHEGRDYDLTALEAPPALLPNEAYCALVKWPHGLIYLSGGCWREREALPSRDYGLVVRAMPAPVETRVECYRGEYYKAKEHGTCIKRPDGSLDWASWEDAE